jgi:hypothetical protein
MKLQLFAGNRERPLWSAPATPRRGIFLKRHHLGAPTTRWLLEVPTLAAGGNGERHPKASLPMSYPASPQKQATRCNKCNSGLNNLHGCALQVFSKSFVTWTGICLHSPSRRRLGRTDQRRKSSLLSPFWNSVRTERSFAAPAEGDIRRRDGPIEGRDR